MGQAHGQRRRQRKRPEASGQLQMVLLEQEYLGRLRLSLWRRGPAERAGNRIEGRGFAV